MGVWIRGVRRVRCHSLRTNRRRTASIVRTDGPAGTIRWRLVPDSVSLVRDARSEGNFDQAGGHTSSDRFRQRPAAGISARLRLEPGSGPRADAVTVSGLPDRRPSYLGDTDGRLSGPGETVTTPGARVLILDGQQRVTSLYGVSRGRPPAFFQGNATAFSGLRFDVEDETFEFYAPPRCATTPAGLTSPPCSPMDSNPALARSTITRKPGRASSPIWSGLPA